MINFTIELNIDYLKKNGKNDWQLPYGTSHNKILPFATHISSPGASTAYEERLRGSGSDTSGVRDVS